MTSHSPGTSPGAAIFTPHHLKPNGRFSDGIPVTAQHFVYSTTRSLTPKLIGGNVFFYFLPIKGALRYHLGRADSVDGLRALDPRTFQIILLRPTASIPQELTWTINDAVAGVRLALTLRKLT